MPGFFDDPIDDAMQRWESITRFSSQLLDTLDLDPIYVILCRADIPEPVLYRWMLAYWCFYHAGVASRITEAKDFHAEMRRAQEEKWPRGRERRHFRGKASAQVIEWLCKTFPRPEKAVESLADADSFVEVRSRITRWPLFGPWIAFKAADMLERVLGHSVKFTLDDLGLYKEPAEAAKILEPGLPLAETVSKLVKKFRHHPAPPREGRCFDIQEAETCLCKWKAFRGGHYWVGQDTHELSHALKGWGPLAKKLHAHLPERTRL